MAWRVYFHDNRSAQLASGRIPLAVGSVSMTIRCHMCDLGTVVNRMGTKDFSLPGDDGARIHVVML